MMKKRLNRPALSIAVDGQSVLTASWYDVAYHRTSVRDTDGSYRAITASANTVRFLDNDMSTATP